jgi:hypothetical protein
VAFPKAAARHCLQRVERVNSPTILIASVETPQTVRIRIGCLSFDLDLLASIIIAATIDQKVSSF